MKNVLFECHFDDYYRVDFVVFETAKSYVIDYHVNITGAKVGQSWFHKSDFARVPKILQVLEYWKDDECNIMRVLLEEFFGKGYRNKIYKVF